MSIPPAPSGVPRASQTWLLGVAVGGYVTLAVSLYFLGWGLTAPGPFDYDIGQTPPRPYSGDPSALIFLVPAVFVGVIGFFQIASQRYFKRRPNQRTTQIALWLNAIASVGFCSLLGLLSTEVALPVFVLAVISFFAGIAISVGNLFWTLVFGARAGARLAAGLCDKLPEQ